MTNEMNFSETAEEMHAGAGEFEEIQELLAMERAEGAEVLEEMRLEAEARKMAGFFSRE